MARKGALEAIYEDDIFKIQSRIGHQDYELAGTKSAEIFYDFQ